MEMASIGKANVINNTSSSSTAIKDGLFTSEVIQNDEGIYTYHIDEKIKEKLAKNYHLVSAVPTEYKDTTSKHASSTTALASRYRLVSVTMIFRKQD